MADQQQDKLAAAREKLKRYQRKQQSRGLNQQQQQQEEDQTAESTEEGGASGLVTEAVGEVSPAAEAYSSHNPQISNNFEQEVEAEGNQESYNSQPSDQYEYSINNPETLTSVVDDGGSGEQPREYTAWEYQEYINVILQELEMVRAQLGEYQEAAAISALSSDRPHQQQQNDAAGLGLYVTSNEHEVAKAEVARLQTENQELLDNNSRLERDNYKLNQKSTELESEFQLSERDKSRMALQIKELEKQVHHHQDQSADLKTKLAATSGSEKRLHDAKVELDGARDEVKGLEIQVETMKSSLAHQKDLVVQLNSQISSLNEDIATKDEKLTDQATKVSILEQSNHTLEKRIVDLQAEIQVAKAGVVAASKLPPQPPAVLVKTESSSSTTNISALSNQVIQITERCQSLQDENSVLVSRLEEMRTRNIELSNEKLAIADKLSGIESKYVRLVSQSAPTSFKSEEASSKYDTNYNAALPPPIPIIPYPSTSPGSSARARRTSADARSLSSPRESDLLTQISSLTAKLLDLDQENKRLAENMGKQEAMKLPQIIGDLEKQNGQLKNELEKERRVTVLLQAEVDALPDMIEKYHQERKALIQRVNKAALDHAVKEKQETVKAVHDTLAEEPSLFIACPMCCQSSTTVFEI